MQHRATAANGLTAALAAGTADKPALEFLTSARNEAETALASVFHLGTVLHQCVGLKPATDVTWKFALESVLHSLQEHLDEVQQKPAPNEYLLRESLRLDSQIEVPVERDDDPEKNAFISMAIGAAVGVLWGVVCTMAYTGSWRALLPSWA